MPRVSIARLNAESEEIAVRLVAALTEKNLSITMAESCTAGLLAGTFCNAPGASGVFDGSLVSYANRVKSSMLNVPEDLLATVGAVSKECAEAMAKGAAALFGADLSLSVTGIAGPGGGTPTKPVGTVYIGCYYKGSVSVKRFRFEGSRAAVRAASVNAALKAAEERLGASSDGTDGS